MQKFELKHHIHTWKGISSIISTMIAGKSRSIFVVFDKVNENLKGIKMIKNQALKRYEQ